jgi:ribosomal protein S18 acetylase RimI-like enzyme
MILHSAEALETLAERWEQLALTGEGGLFLSHRWLRSWWRAFHGVDQLWLLTVEPDEGGPLEAAWPLHLKAPRSGALRASELHVLGDLGGAQQSILCRRGAEPEVAEALVGALFAARGWDVLDVPVTYGALADQIERAVVERGGKVDRAEATGRPYLELPPAREWEEYARTRRPQRGIAGAVYAPAEIDLPHALDELLRLLRKEWAAREAASPATDPHAVQFLSDVVPALHAVGCLRLGLVGLDGAGAIAADLVVHDGERAVQLLRGADPEHAAAGVVEQLTFGSLEAAARAGARRFELADDELPWRSGRTHVPRLRVWNATTVGRLHRGVTALTDAVRAIEPGGDKRPSLAYRRGAWRAFDRLRSRAPDVVQRAVARVAAYSTLHLYRGELFTRNVRQPAELSLRLFTRSEFDAFSDGEREEFMLRLDLQESYCRQKWERGDMTVLASLNEAEAQRPAGILWCARSRVYVPDIGREVRPGVGEAYIHDVYVHPDERGRQVAPAMLEFLARELRGRDVYRAWALIERTNVASTRAFEKAAYASVADVVYARMGLASRLMVRPPDPEARSFLGLT